MKWKRETEWNLLSSCQRYRISKALTPSGPVYHLWAVDAVPHLVCGTLDECKSEAVRHGEHLILAGSKSETRRAFRMARR